MKCKNCNHEVPDDAAFCPNCGAVINRSSETETSGAAYTDHSDTQSQGGFYNGGSVNNGGNFTQTPRMPMKTDRSFLMFLLLSIVTCGIYGIVFMYKLTEDVNTLCEGDGKKTMNYIVMLLLDIVTCGVYGIVWYYQLGQRLAENCQNRYGVQPSSSANMILVLVLCGYFTGSVTTFVAQYFLIETVNNMSIAYNQGK